MSFRLISPHTMLFRRRRGQSTFGTDIPAAWVCAIRHAVKAQNSCNDVLSKCTGRAQPPPLLWLFSPYCIAPECCIVGH
jgi:hypothetical protein